jgi:hypothetical protein
MPDKGLQQPEAPDFPLTKIYPSRDFILAFVL